MTDTEHTPLPWHNDDYGNEVEIHGDGTNTLHIYVDREPQDAHARAHGPRLTPADAALIVRRVNAGPAVDALIEALGELHVKGPTMHLHDGPWDMCAQGCTWPCPTAQALTTYQEATRE